MAWEITRFQCIKWGCLKLPCVPSVQTSLVQRAFPDGFPCILKIDEMTLYVLENFEWHPREVAFSPLPLPSDYEDLCPNFDLATAEEATRDFSLPDIPQVVFLAMLLNDAMKLGVLRGWIIGIIELALKELQWSTFQAWVGCNKSNILRACRLEADSDQE